MIYDISLSRHSFASTDYVLTLMLWLGLPLLMYVASVPSALYDVKKKCGYMNLPVHTVLIFGLPGYLPAISLFYIYCNFMACEIIDGPNIMIAVY